MANFRQALVADDPAAVGAREGHTMPADLPPPDGVAAEHIRKRLEMLSPWLDGKQRRLLAAVEATLIGVDRAGQVAALVHLAPRSVRAGLRMPFTLRQPRWTPGCRVS